MARQCLFCDETSLTLEHIWPDWIVQIYPEARYMAGRAHGKSDIDPSTIREWPQNLPEQTAKCVCEDCNGIWMSDLETHVKPILLPLIVDSRRRRRLTDEDQTALTIWATLRSMVFEHQIPIDKRFYTQAERVQFRDTLEPPANTHAWFASFPGHL